MTFQAEGELHAPALQLHRSLGGIYDGVEDLDESECEIRLLRLHPGNADDPVCCHFSKTSLDSDPSYEALSYTWREPSLHGSRQIYVSGIEHDVTPNLAEALRSIRSTTQTRALWVDALCIDQGNPDEKSRQVRMMGEIYASADQVLAWLGPANDRSDEGFALLRKLRLADYLDCDKFAKLILLDTAVAEGSNMCITRPLVPIHEFLDRSYWQRVWAVQEISLAKSVCLLRGTASLPWNALKPIFRAFSEHTLGCCDQFDEATRYELCCIRDTLNGIIQRYNPTEDRLLPRLHLVRELKATDARDKIYAILGLIRPDHDLPDLDYRSSPAIVFQRWAVHLIETTGSLDVLLYAGTISPLGLPSWVPDWTRTGNFRSGHSFAPHWLVSSVAETTYNGLYPETNARPVIDGYYLQLAAISRGHIVQTAAELDSVLASRGQTAFWEFQSYETIAGLSDEDFESSATPPPGSLFDEFWQVLTCNNLGNPQFLGQSEDHQNSETQLQQAYRVYRGCRHAAQSGSPHTMQNVIYKFKAMVARISAGRTMFVTSQGRVGFGPEDTRPGDAVYSIAGSAGLYIARQVAMTAFQRPRLDRVFRFVGWAFSHADHPHRNTFVPSEPLERIYLV